MSKSRRVGAQNIGMDASDLVSVEGLADSVEGRGQGMSPASEPDGLGLDSGPELAETKKSDDNSRPYCPRHNCLMIAQTSRNVATIYKCRVKECDAVEVRMRPENPAPKEPQWCPLCLKSAESEVACEVNGQRSTPTELLLQCPRCKWEVRVARPTAAKAVAKIRRQTLAEGPMAAAARPSY